MHPMIMLSLKITAAACNAFISLLVILVLLTKHNRAVKFPPSFSSFALYVWPEMYKETYTLTWKVVETCIPPHLQFKIHLAKMVV
jgi:hypothetical protein